MVRTLHAITSAVIKRKPYRKFAHEVSTNGHLTTQEKKIACNHTLGGKLNGATPAVITTSHTKTYKKRVRISTTRSDI